MSLHSALHCIETALNQACGCSASLLCMKKVFGLEKGPSSGTEILATIYLDDPSMGFWYGHILPHPQYPKRFVSLIVWTEKLINADNVPLLFRRFHYWVKDRLEYHPCSIQNNDDAYAESNSLEAAAFALARMITNFDLDKRSGVEGTDYETSPTDLRIFSVYGLADAKDDKGRFPPVPMATGLRLVKALW